MPVIAVPEIDHELLNVSFIICVFRIDCFSNVSMSLFGEKLKEQVQERLTCHVSG